MWFQILTWTIAVFSIIGVVLNIQKKRSCFYFWSGTNASWVVIDFARGIYAQAVLFFVYFVLAIWGIIAWKKPEATPEQKEIVKLRGYLYTAADILKEVSCESPGYDAFIRAEGWSKEIIKILQEKKAA